MAMEHVASGTLADRLGPEGPLEPDEAVDIALRVTAALGEAYRRGVIHRKVKPHNVFLTPEGDVMVGDFGIAQTRTVSSTARAVVPQGPPATLRIEAVPARSEATPVPGFAARVSPAPVLPEHPATTGSQTGSVAPVEPASSAPSVQPTLRETESEPVQPWLSQPAIPEPAAPVVPKPPAAVPTPGVSSPGVPDASGASPEDVTVVSPVVRAATSGVRPREEASRRPVELRPFTDGPGAAGAPREGGDPSVAAVREPAL